MIENLQPCTYNTVGNNKNQINAGRERENGRDSTHCMPYLFSSSYASCCYFVLLRYDPHRRAHQNRAVPPHVHLQLVVSTSPDARINSISTKFLLGGSLVIICAVSSHEARDKEPVRVVVPRHAPDEPICV